MRIYIPMADDEEIPEQILKNLSQQSMPLTVYPCKTPRIEGNKRAGECSSRNMGLNMMINGPYEFAAMQDRDMMNLDTQNYERCVKFLEGHEDYAAIGLPWKPYEITDHIMLTGLVLRVKYFIDILFRLDHRNHLCLTFKEDIEKKGYKYGFLPSDNRVLIKDIFKSQ